MSSGIPTLPKKQSRSDGADAGDSDNENTQILREEESDAETTETGSEINDSDDESSSGTQVSSRDDSDEDEDEAGGVADEQRGVESGDEEGVQEEGDDDDGPRTVAAASSSTKNKKKRGATTSGRKKNMEEDMTFLGVPHGIQFDDDDDDDDSSVEDKDSSEYFQKLKKSVHESYIDTYHPESMSHNYDEIQTLARVVRNSAGVIVDDLHRTIPIMTKYEKTRILGQRAKQLNEGSPAFIKIDSTVIDGYLIAMKELEQKKTPFIIRRPLPNGGSEYWRVQDLEIL